MTAALLAAAITMALTAPGMVLLLFVFRDDLIAAFDQPHRTATREPRTTDAPHLEVSSPRQPESQPRRHSPEVQAR